MSFNLSCTAQDLNAAVTKANAAAPQSTTYTKAEVNALVSKRQPVYVSTKTGQSASFDNIIRVAAAEAGYQESDTVGFSFMAYSDVSGEYIYAVGQFLYGSFIQKKWIETTTLSATTNNTGTVAVSGATGTFIRAVVNIF